jgi:hypothetical protein
MKKQNSVLENAGQMISTRTNHKEIDKSYNSLNKKDYQKTIEAPHTNHLNKYLTSANTQITGIDSFEPISRRNR